MSDFLMSQEMARALSDAEAYDQGRRDAIRDVAAHLEELAGQALREHRHMASVCSEGQCIAGLTLRAAAASVRALGERP